MGSFHGGWQIRLVAVQALQTWPAKVMHEFY